MVALIFLGVCLFFNTLYIYRRTKNYILPSPSLLLVLVFFLFTIVDILNYDFFGDYFYFSTAVIIILYIISFQIGELSISRSSIGNFILSEDYMIVDKKRIYICIFICLLCSYFEYKRFMALGAALGANSLSTAFIAVRFALGESANGNDMYDLLPIGRFESLVVMLASIISYICLYIFLYKLIILKQIEVTCIAPFIAYVPALLFATGRSVFLPFLIFSCFTALYLYTQKKKKILWNTKKVVRSSLYIFVAFIIFFLVMSLLMNPEDEKGFSSDFRPGDYLSLYIGSSLFSFNNYINFDLSSSEYIGQLTFRDTFNNLRTLGLNTPKPQMHLDNYYWKGGDGLTGANVYTGFYMIIKDYGILGGLIIMYIIGLIYGSISKRINTKKIRSNNVFTLFIIGSLYNAVIWLCYNYQFYTYFSFQFLIQIFLFMMIQRFLIKSKSNRDLISGQRQVSTIR